MKGRKSVILMFIINLVLLGKIITLPPEHFDDSVLFGFAAVIGALGATYGAGKYVEKKYQSQEDGKTVSYTEGGGGGGRGDKEIYIAGKSGVHKIDA